MYIKSSRKRRITNIKTFNFNPEIIGIDFSRIGSIHNNLNSFGKLISANKIDTNLSKKFAQLLRKCFEVKKLNISFKIKN